jgi:uncharacterized MAPEG superfamily protein
VTADLWTVFAAVVLPYVPYLLVGWYKNRRGLYDPANPRDSNAQLEGWSARAKAAEANSWEALAQYVGVSFVAHEAGADPDLLAALGAAWVVARLAYYVVYVAGWGRTRIAVWFVGLLLLFARFGAIFVSP